jgi:predicted alpha-1,2-mannosidase
MAIMKRLLTSAILFGLALSVSPLYGETLIGASSPQALSDYVNPLIGNANSNGQTVIGPTLPHGSIHPSPDSFEGGGSGYKIGKPVRGFSQTHVSGVGWTTYGNLLLSPQVGLDVSATGHDSPITNEVAKAYSYQATLSRYGINAALTPTHNAVIYRLSYPKGDQSFLMLDLAHQIPGQIVVPPNGPNGEFLDADVALSVDGRSFSGSSRYSGGWGAGPYRIYFYGELDQAPAAFGTFKNGVISAGQLTQRWSAKSDRLGSFWHFSPDATNVSVKLAISFLSVERAKSHLLREIPDWSFETVRDGARAKWDAALSSIVVSGGDSTQRQQFYTALYHAQIMPRDRTGEFERFGDAPMWDDHFAVWDTWRTKFPLMVLINPEVVRGSINSFSERLRVDGHVRDSFVAGNGWKIGIADQGGNNIDNVIADAYVKGVKGIDWQRAYGVMTFNGERERRGTLSGSVNRPTMDTDEYRTRGWLASGMMAVSNTLEYAYNDYNVAQVARGLGRKDEAERYFRRSRSWQFLFNPDAESEGFTGFIMPRDAQAKWIEGVNMTQYAGSWKPHFYEASTWGYSFFVPHQASRLIELMGGRDTFARRLDYGLEKSYVDFHNEPAFLAPALFHYAQRPDLSAKWMVKFAREEVTPLGYPGDDDSGAMSAYYVWASLGLFPNAGQDLYLLNGPQFDRLVVSRPEEGKLVITRTGQGNYVASVRLNGRRLHRSWLRHSQIKGDTQLDFVMSVTPTKWGTRTPPPSDPARSQLMPARGS